jgi:hypothetical protein
MQYSKEYIKDDDFSYTEYGYFLHQRIKNEILNYHSTYRSSPTLKLSVGPEIYDALLITPYYSSVNYTINFYDLTIPLKIDWSLSRYEVVYTFEDYEDIPF